MATRPKKRGRPEIEPGLRKSRNLTFRGRSDLRDRLSEAATRSERSISEEIEHRLVQSFNQELEIKRAFGDENTFGLLRLLQGAIEYAARSAASFKDPTARSLRGPWLQDPYVFGQVRLAVQKLLDTYAPPGDAASPGLTQETSAYGAEIGADAVEHALRNTPNLPRLLRERTKKLGEKREHGDGGTAKPKGDYSDGN